VAVEGGGARWARDKPGFGPKSENSDEFTEQKGRDGDERDPQQHVDLCGDVISKQEIGLKAGDADVVIGPVAVGFEGSPEMMP